MVYFYYKVRLMKRIKYIILFLIVGVLLTGCGYKYAKFTREIRHSGFTLSSFTFKCPPIYDEEGTGDLPEFYIGNYIL